MRREAISYGGYRVLICGQRDFTDIEAIRAVIESELKSKGELVIIEGGARGADTIARDLAKEYGIPVEEYPALWDSYGRGAGPIRNKQMIKEGKPDIVYAFYDDKSKSKGTKNMVMQARKAGLKVVENK